MGNVGRGNVIEIVFGKWYEANTDSPWTDRTGKLSLETRRGVPLSSTKKLALWKNLLGNAETKDKQQKHHC